LSGDPQGAVSRATSRVIETSRRAGIEPSLKLTAAFSDGEALYAVRYATDDHAPTLYTSVFRNGGRCIVSEPFDRNGGEWQAIPPASFVTMTGGGTGIRPFAPAVASLALVG
jgi:glutamine amidotransferase